MLKILKSKSTNFCQKIQLHIPIKTISIFKSFEIKLYQQRLRSLNPQKQKVKEQIVNINVNRRNKYSNMILHNKMANTYWYSANKQSFGSGRNPQDKLYSNTHIARDLKIDKKYKTHEQTQKDYICEVKIDYSQNKKLNYYNWDDPQSYQKAVKQMYFLDDLLDGFDTLRSKNIQYNEQHLHFMIYVGTLFTHCQEQIMQLFLPSFIKNQQKADFYKTVPIYMKSLKIFCAQPRNRQSKIKQERKIIESYLKRRLNHPESRKSISLILQSLRNFGFEGMENIIEIFDEFKNLLNKQLIESQFKLSNQKIRVVIQAIHIFNILNQKIKKQLFFSNFPDTFKNDQKKFQNLIKLLPQLLVDSSLQFTNWEDLARLNLIISKCTNFKQKQTKSLLRRYSEHLVMINQIQLINFQAVLDTI